MTEINKTFCRTLRTDLEKDLAKITKKYGVTIDIGAMTYSSDDVRVKLNFRLEGLESKAVKDYKAMKKLLGLPAMTKVVTIHGDRYKITGFHSRARKYPISVRKIGTKSDYKISVDMLKANV